MEAWQSKIISSLAPFPCTRTKKRENKGHDIIDISFFCCYGNKAAYLSFSFFWFLLDPAFTNEHSRRCEHTYTRLSAATLDILDIQKLWPKLAQLSKPCGSSAFSSLSLSSLGIKNRSGQQQQHPQHHNDKAEEPPTSSDRITSETRWTQSSSLPRKGPLIMFRILRLKLH